METKIYIEDSICNCFYDLVFENIFKKVDNEELMNNLKIIYVLKKKLNHFVNKSRTTTLIFLAACIKCILRSNKADFV